MKIKVKVKLFATLRNNRFKIKEFSLDTGTNIQKVLDELEIKDKDVSILLVNGRDAEKSKVLENNDVISVFPPVGGG